MPNPAIESAYRRLLLDTRARGYALSRSSVALVDAAFRDAVRALESDIALADSPLTRARASAMRREILTVLDTLERRSAAATARGVSLTVDDLVAMHQAATERLVERFGPAGVNLNAFARVPARVVAVLAARRGGTAVTFRTLLRRHLLAAAPALDRLLVSGIARGQSSRNLARDIVTLLQEQTPEGIDPSDVAGLRTLKSDATRIARSETLNAMREANAQSLAASPIVLAAKWQLSGRHFAIPGNAPDECDVLAELDLYGYGPGMYTPECWPLAPHPNCSCVQGGPTRFRDPSEWGATKKPPPPCAVPGTVALKDEWEGDVSDAKRDRVLVGVGTALSRKPYQRGVTPRVRAAPAATVAERKAVYEYTNYRYKGINRALRDGVPQANATDKAIVAGLDSLAAKTPTTVPRTVYRGVSSDDNVSRLSGEEVRKLTGTVIEQRGFMSTSADPDVASNLSDGVVYEVRVPVGTRAIDVPAILSRRIADAAKEGETILAGRERELLIARGYRFRVAEVVEDAIPNVHFAPGQPHTLAQHEFHHKVVLELIP